MKGKSFLFFSAFVCKAWLFTSSGSEWTGEINPSVVIHITDIILMHPPSEARLDWRGRDVLSLQSCGGSAAIALQLYDEGRAFSFDPARNRCWCHKQAHWIFSIRPVIACMVHWWPQCNVPQALNTGHLMEHVCLINSWSVFRYVTWIMPSKPFGLWIYTWC